MLWIRGKKESLILALLIITWLKAYSMISPIHEMPRPLSFNPHLSLLKSIPLSYVTDEEGEAQRRRYL